jgi:uncharacterized protein YkwD
VQPLRRFHALGVAALALGCAASPPQRPPATPPVPAGAAGGVPAPPPESAPPGPAPLEPSRPGAIQYGATPTGTERALVAPDALRGAIAGEARALARKQGLPVPAEDPRLDLAMNDLARNLRPGDVPAGEAVDFVLVHYGIPEPSPQLCILHGTAGADGRMRAQAVHEIGEVYKTAPVARIGIGIVRDAALTHVVIGLQEKHVDLEPVLRQLPHGGVAAVAGRMEPHYNDARLAITMPNGTVSEQDTPLSSGRFRGELRCGPDGRYQVEVTAVDALGAAVLANFPVYCGVTPPTSGPGAAAVRRAAIDSTTAEKRMLELVNHDRAAAGLRPVVVDAQLTAIARAHSRDMAEHDFVGHVSPRSGSTVDRVKHAGIAPQIVLENVGRAYSIEEAEKGFLASPGHRVNIVEPGAARLGIGVAFGKAVTGTEPMFVTQLFTN